MKTDGSTNIKTVINPGYNEILGTDEYDDSKEDLGKVYHEYRKKWNENPKNAIVDEFPLHVDIESTNACNLRCRMCMRNFMKESIGHMDWKLFKKIIDEGAKYGLPSIKLNYRGEPLMHPRIVDMVKYAKDRGIIEVQLNTNGMLLTEEMAKSLIEAGLDRIIFSVDGATKEMYEKIRTGAKYETVVANIKNMIELRNGMDLKKPSVRVQIVETKENSREIDDFVNMWKYTANRIGINKMRDPDGVGADSTYSDVFACPQIWQRMMICWDGEVRMCCGDWKGMYTIGNINDSTIHELWHGKKYNAVREAHKNGEYDKFDVCVKCEVNKR